MKKFLLLFVILIPILSNGQPSDFGNWFIYFGNMDFKERWNWHNEVQYRNYNFIGDLEQLLIRTGVGYNLTEANNNVLLGYGYILSQNYIEGTNEKEDVNEHRIYQQYITRQTFSRFLLQHRYRFEQRWVEGDFRLRFRYFLGINFLLNNRKMVDNTWYISAYNEIFIKYSFRNSIFGSSMLLKDKVLDTIMHIF